jgi:signal transduction histidine kinase
MRECCIISAILISCLTLQGQGEPQPVIDSLNHQLRRAKEDTNKVLLLISAGQQIENSSPSTAKNYYLQARELSKKLGYTSGEIKFYLNYTAVLNLQGQYDSSLLLNLESVKLAKEKGIALDIARCIQNTGVSWYYLEDYEKCTAHYLEAVPYFEKAKDTLRLSILYSNLGIAFRDASLFDKSLEYHQKALKLSRLLNNPYESGLTLSNIGILYTDLKEYDKAEAVLTEALQLGEQTNDDYLKQQALLNASNLYFKKKDFANVKKYAGAALQYSKKLGDTRTAAICLYALAEEAFQRKDFSGAMALANEGLTIAAANQFKEQQRDLHTLLASLALVKSAMGDYAVHKQAADSVSQLLLEATVQKNVQLLDKKFETEKKNNQIVQLAKDKKVQSLWNYILAGLTGSLLIISFLVYRTYRQKAKIQQQQIADLEKEKQLLATQSLLKGQEEERSRLAKDLHDGLGGLLSGVKLQLGAMKGNLILSESDGKTFSNALLKLDESIHELRRVAHNMMPEALMKLGLQQALQDYCDGLSESQPFQINREFYGLEKRLEPSVEIVLYRIVQELLNNTVKHSGATAVLVQLIRQDNQISVTVEDNGKGFDTTTKDFSKGAGLANVKSRVDYLKGHLDIRTAPGKGTSVHIECVING